jgi:hypothetical protein
MVMYSLFPALYMRACSSRSIDTAFDFLVQQIYATLQSKYRMVLLLLLDMTEAIDRVVLAQLLHSLRERKTHQWIVKLIGNFISKRTMTLYLPGHNIDAFPTTTCTIQGALLSPIIFLLNIASFIIVCNSLTISPSRTGFVDNLKTMAYGKPIE